MKSMPLRPRPGYGPYDGAFPVPAQDLAGTVETDWSAVDHQIGRRLLLIGGVVTAVGSLVGMTVKDQQGKSKAGRLAKAGMLAGAAIGTWAMLDSSGRQQLVAEVRAMTTRPAEGLSGLGADLEQQKRDQIRQRALLSTIGLGPLAEPIHVQKAMRDLDPVVGEQLATQHTEQLRAAGAKPLPIANGGVPVASTEKVSKTWLIPAVVGVAVVGGSLLLKG